MKKDRMLQKLTRAGMIAALYAALTLLLAPISFGTVQIRVAEALTILPLFFPEAIPGVTVGCLLANAIGAGIGVAGVWDIPVGTLATLLAALLTARCKKLWQACIPPIVTNTLLVGPMLTFLFLPRESWWAMLPVNMLTVGLGEAAALFVLGLPLGMLIKKQKGKSMKNRITQEEEKKNEG